MLASWAFLNIDKPESKSQVQAESQIEKGKRNMDSGLSLKSYGPPPPHPQLTKIVISFLDKIYWNFK